MRRGKFAIVVCLVVAAASTVSPARTADRPEPSRVEPGLLSAPGAMGVLIRFHQRVPADLSAIPGLTPRFGFESIPAVAAIATPAAIRILTAREDVAYLEADKPLAFDLDSATIASRAKDVWSGTAGLLDEDQQPLDGTGVGIAIVDSGLDGLHPDFQAPGKVGGNYQVTPLDGVVIDTPWNAVISGHGTHVAGIAAGNGLASEGAYRGAAPGATLYTFDMYVGTQSLAAKAFDWILQHGGEQDPPIRVVNNSWHCSASSCQETFNPDQLHVHLATALAQSGVTVTWAAGNHDTDVGNDGFASSTNTEAHNQTPGIIGVANYVDEVSTNEVGVRNGCIAGGSSRGSSAEPDTWPDLAAPGTSVLSTWAVTPAVDTSDVEVDSRNPVDGANTYRRLSGTSMAAPHVAGIVALMLQANPVLTPADIEYILKATAEDLDHCSYNYGGTAPTPTTYVRADATHPWDGSNYTDGHGLVDAVAAVEMAREFDGIPAAVPAEEIPVEFIRARPGIEPDLTLYLAGDGALQTAYPDAPAPRATVMPPNELLLFTSEPLTDALTIEGVQVDPFLGSTAEIVALLNPPRLRVRVERVPQAGAPEVLASSDTRLWQIGPLGPTDRDFAYLLPAPVTLDAGDTIRLTIGVISPPLDAGAPPPYAFWSLYWESATASRVTLGQIVERPAEDTRAWCETRQDCADLDATHMMEGMTCGKVPVRLTWDGPPGSALIFTCAGASAVCAIPPSEPAEQGHCETEFEFPHVLTYKGGMCSYRLPDGGRGGTGRCVGLQLLEDDD